MTRPQAPTIVLSFEPFQAKVPQVRRLQASSLAETHDELTILPEDEVRTLMKVNEQMHKQIRRKNKEIEKQNTLITGLRTQIESLQMYKLSTTSYYLYADPKMNKQSETIKAQQEIIASHEEAWKLRAEADEIYKEQVRMELADKHSETIKLLQEIIASHEAAWKLRAEAEEIYKEQVKAELAEAEAIKLTLLGMSTDVTPVPACPAAVGSCPSNETHPAAPTIVAAKYIHPEAEGQLKGKIRRAYPPIPVLYNAAKPVIKEANDKQPNKQTQVSRRVTLSVVTQKSTAAAVEQNKAERILTPRRRLSFSPLQPTSPLTPNGLTVVVEDTANEGPQLYHILSTPSTPLPRSPLPRSPLPRSSLQTATVPAITLTNAINAANSAVDSNFVSKESEERSLLKGCGIFV